MLAFAGMLNLTAGASLAYADTNPTPIAVPLIGTQGKASLYPSTINVVARGGLAQTGNVAVALHGVTHPCPEELAVLLVHNDTDAFLLMNNAGGCRPLQGTRLVFTFGSAPIPDTLPANPPFSASQNADASVYGAIPFFPAPAPPNVFSHALPPPQTTNINGTWSLYVLDTVPGNRGVIAGGWSLTYDTSPSFETIQTTVRVPAFGSGPGGAGNYPIMFDLSTVPVGVQALEVMIDVTLHHTWPDNIRMVLQSPQGTAVALMANAGGGHDILPGATLRFADWHSTSLPDSDPIEHGFYKPGNVYGADIALGLPAPQPPYATTLAAFNGQPARGIWKLWGYDDSGGDIGEIESALMTVRTENTPSFSFSGQAAPPLFSADQPFVRFEASLVDEFAPIVGIWRSVVNGEFYDAGAFRRGPNPLDLVADVPMKAGTNVVTTYMRGGNGGLSASTRTVIVSEFTYSLAEGATGSFFDLDVTLANPTAISAPVSVEFLPENGSVVLLADGVDARSPLTIRVNDHVPGAATSTIVHSIAAIPLAVERTMSWDARGYGGHGGTSVSPATRWLFAEGSQGYFNTFVLLANANASPVDVTVDFLLEGGGVVTMPVNVPAKSRRRAGSKRTTASASRKRPCAGVSPMGGLAGRGRIRPTSCWRIRIRCQPRSR
jgi:hypothetical protein